MGGLVKPDIEMSEFKQFRRTQIAEMRDVTQSDIDNAKIVLNWTLASVPPSMPFSVSGEDLKNGSPRLGDKIARNPKNHLDQWLVAEQYFKDNFESID